MQADEKVSREHGKPLPVGGAGCQPFFFITQFRLIQIEETKISFIAILKI